MRLLPSCPLRVGLKRYRFAGDVVEPRLISRRVLGIVRHERAPAVVHVRGSCVWVARTHDLAQLALKRLVYVYALPVKHSVRMARVVIQRRPPLLLQLDAQLCRLMIAFDSPRVLRVGHRGSCVSPCADLVCRRHALQSLHDLLKRFALNDALRDLLRDLRVIPPLVYWYIHLRRRQKVGLVADKLLDGRCVVQLKTHVHPCAPFECEARPVGIISKRFRGRVVDDLHSKLVAVRQRLRQIGKHLPPALSLKHLPRQPISVRLLRDLSRFELRTVLFVVPAELCDELVKFSLDVARCFRVYAANAAL